MSRANYIQMAEDVKNLLNSGALGFVATRGYAPRKEVQDLASLTVTVVPATASRRFVTRNGLKETTADIEVWFQKQMEFENLAQGDAITLIMDQTDDFLSADSRRQLTGLAGTNSMLSLASLLESTPDPIFDPAHMREKGCFTGVLKKTYQVTETA